MKKGAEYVDVDLHPTHRVTVFFFYQISTGKGHLCYGKGKYLPSSGPSVVLNNNCNGHRVSLANTTLVAYVIWTGIVLSVLLHFINLLLIL
jgi:hypothetical protein